MVAYARPLAAGRPAGSAQAVPTPDRQCQTVGYAPFKANAVWAYDFVFDATAQGQPIKCLTVVDEYTRECLAIDVAGSIRSRRVIDVLARLISVRGAPRFLRSDNGPEFVSQAILAWIHQAGIVMALNDPGDLRTDLVANQAVSPG